MATKKQQHSHLFVFAHSQSHLFQYGGGVDVRSGCPWGIDVPTVYLWRGCFSLERRRCFPKKKRKTDAAIFEQAALPESFYPFKQVVITDSILMIQFLLNINNKQVKDTVTQESWTVESFLEHWGFSLIIWLNHHFVLIHSRLHHFQLKQKLWSSLLEAVSVHENQFKKLFLSVNCQRPRLYFTDGIHKHSGWSNHKEDGSESVGSHFSALYANNHHWDKRTRCLNTKK